MSSRPASWGAAAGADWGGPELAALQQELAPPDDDGRSRTRSAIGGQADPPYDLQSPEPRAVDLLGLWKRLGRKPDPNLLASLGPTGRSSSRMGSRRFTRWGGGHGQSGAWATRRPSSTSRHGRSTLRRPANTSRSAPSSRTSVSASPSTGGSRSRRQRSRRGALPGVGLNGASIEVGVDERVAFAIRYEFRVLKVQAGPVAPGGARWNLYRQDRPLDDFHPLLQTLLVPRGVRGVTVEVPGVGT